MIKTSRFVYICNKNKALYLNANNVIATLKPTIKVGSFFILRRLLLDDIV